MACIEALPDDILLHIFSFLKSWNLLNIIETCPRFDKVGRDKSLWHSADFSDGCLSAGQILRRVIGCLHSCTKRIQLRGHKKKCHCQHRWKTDLLTPNLLEKLSISTPNLTELMLSEAVIDARKLKISHFKNTARLKKLSILNCEIINLPSLVSEGSYFKNICQILPNLEHFEISHCSWVQDYDLMVLSKLDSLKTLILRSDIRIGVTMAYMAISFRFGFKSLEVLDMRGTSLQSSDIQSIVQNGKLKSLYLGPIGAVKRVSDEAIDEFSLVIPDPNRREEPKQQVVVINMGPNGPYWSHAKEEELDMMGLQWVKKGMNHSPKEDSAKDDDHYFIGKEGKVFKVGESNESSSVGNSPCENGENSLKRKLPQDSDDAETAHKRSKLDQEDSESCSSNCSISESEDAHNYPKVVNGTLPDEGLSDVMIPSFRLSNQLQTLVLAGCSITDGGLQELIKLLPLLKYIDISNTHVTEAGIHSAQLVKPNCIFIGGRVHVTTEKR